MNPTLLQALKEQTEARAAFQSLAENASEQDRKAAEDRIVKANQAVVKAIEDATPAAAPRDVSSRVQLRDYLNAYSRGKRLQGGAAAELNKGLGLDDETQLPWDVLAPERRADADPPSVTGLNQSTSSILRRVFKGTDIGFLGVRMPSVSPGLQVFPVLTGGGSASMQAANSAKDADAFSMSVVTISPTRATTRYLLNLENMATIGGELEGVLRDDMRQQLTGLINDQIISGDGSAPNLSGIVTTLTTPSDPAAVVKAEDLRGLVIDALDDQYVRNESDIRLLVGLRGYQAARKVFQDTTKTIDGIQAMTNLGASVKSTTRIAGKRTPADTSSTETAFVAYAIRTSQPQGFIAPIWNAVSIIRDPYSNAASGQVALTAHVLFGAKFLRQSGWAQVALKVL